MTRSEAVDEAVTAVNTAHRALAGNQGINVANLWMAHAQVYATLALSLTDVTNVTDNDVVVTNKGGTLSS